MVVLAERGTTDTHPRFQILYARIYTLYYTCDVTSAPRGERDPFAILAIEGRIGLAFVHIGVTQVVDMYAIDIIVLDNLLYYGYDIVGCSGIAGLHIPGSVVMAAQ